MKTSRLVLAVFLVVASATLLVGVASVAASGGDTIAAAPQLVPTPYPTASGIWGSTGLVPVCDTGVIRQCVAECNAWRWPLKTCSLCYVGCGYLRPTPTPMPSNADCVWSRLTPWCQKV